MAGARTINIPDTGRLQRPRTSCRSYHPQPDRTGAERRPGIFSVQLPQRSGAGGCQLAGGGAGRARQVECTINGLGERADNRTLEEIVMTVAHRPPTCSSSNVIRTPTPESCPASRLGGQHHRLPCSPTRPSSGANALSPPLNRSIQLIRRRAQAPRNLRNHARRTWAGTPTAW